MKTYGGNRGRIDLPCLVGKAGNRETRPCWRMTKIQRQNRKWHASLVGRVESENRQQFIKTDREERKSIIENNDRRIRRIEKR